MNFFDMIDDIINRSSDRWSSIEERLEILKSDIRNGKNIEVADLANLLVLLIEHMRPMNPSKEDLQNVGRDIKDMLKK